jgi:hypothetical protein
MQPTGPFVIFTGDDKTMSLKAAYTVSGNPVDLTSCTAIDVALPNADGTFLHLTLTGGVAITSPAVLGQFTAAITTVQSALLQPGELQDFDVTFTISTKRNTVRYYQALSVFENN